MSDPASNSHQSAAAELAEARRNFQQTIVEYQDRLYNLVFRMVGDREEARELTQEAFLRAWAGLVNFRADSAMYTWLARIGMNLALSHLRRRQRRDEQSLDAVGGADCWAQNREISGPQAAQGNEQRQQVAAALGRLGDEHRAVLVLRDVDGLDYEHIAQVLELPLGTLKSRLFRARLALREQLQGYLE